MNELLEKDRRFLQRRHNIADVMDRGYHWFTEKYLTVVARVEKAGLKKDDPLLSDAYYLIGDVHDFCECPMAAIKAYRKSFQLDRRHSEALREMGSMYEYIGNYRKATTLLKKAIKMNPNDDLALFDLERLFSGAPFYKPNDILWQARECLAQSKPRQALKLLAKRTRVKARQIRACAYGMLNDAQAIAAEWSGIASVKGTIEKTYADCFYTHAIVQDNVCFWQNIVRCARQNRFVCGSWPIFESLYDAIFPKHRKPNSKADTARANKCTLLLAQYHIARIEQDKKLASRLAKRYPQWKEINQLAATLPQISTSKQKLTINRFRMRRQIGTTTPWKS